MGRAAKRDICQDFTNKVIEVLEDGRTPWRCEWSQDGRAAIPENAATGAAYNGINIITLWVAQMVGGYTSGRWLTYKQAEAAGGQVRKGEKGALGIFYKTLEKDTGEIAADGSPQIEHIPMLRAFTLFNLDQVDGLDDLREGANRERYAFTPAQAGERLMVGCGVKINEGGADAFYTPATDQITMPDRDRFEDSGHYYATFAHELTHATGHRSRCDRKPYETTTAHGARAFEELVAELGCLFATAHVGLPQPVTNHAAYIGSWLEVLKGDKRAIFKAAAQAQTATNWILQSLEAHGVAEAA